MKPNIFFIVVDSLRSDCCYNSKSVIPNTESIIENGVFFNQAISSMPSTSGSLASIFTGLFPFRLGMGDEKYGKLDPDIPTFVGHLKKIGYHTYATTSEVNSLLGITADFDLQLKQTLHNNYYRLFSGFGEKIIQKLTSMSEPWFFYVHINDLHKPIIVPNDFKAEKYGQTDYEKMVSAIDSWIGKFLEKCSIKNTLIIFTADHGEYLNTIQVEDDVINLEPGLIEKSLWQIGNKIPSQLYGPKKKVSMVLRKIRHTIRENKIKNLNLTVNEKERLLTTRMNFDNHVRDDVLKVPLVFYGLGLHSKNISQQIRLVDIFPTILELIGEKSFNGDVDGKSLMPLINGESFQEDPAYFESMPHIEKNHKKLVGIRFNNFKYLRNKNNDKENVQLYDLKEDPFEINNIAETKTDTAKNLETTLQSILQTTQKKSNSSLDEYQQKKVEEELKKLGYL